MFVLLIDGEMYGLRGGFDRHLQRGALDECSVHVLTLIIVGLSYLCIAFAANGSENFVGTVIDNDLLANLQRRRSQGLWTRPCDTEYSDYWKQDLLEP